MSSQTSSLPMLVTGVSMSVNDVSGAKSSSVEVVIVGAFKDDFVLLLAVA